MFSTNETKVGVDTDFGYKIIYILGHILSSPLLHLEYKNQASSNCDFICYLA